MSCIVLDIELADKNNNNELGVFIDGKVHGNSLRPPKKCKLTKKLQGIVWISGRLDYSGLSDILPRAEKGEYFAKGTEQSKILANLLDKEVESLEDHGFPKVQDLLDKKFGIRSSYQFRNKTTLHCSERKAKLFGNWIMRYLML